VFMVMASVIYSKALKGAYMKGASDSQLITKYKMDPIMGGTE